MSVNINLGALKIVTVDKGMVNIGPAVQHVIRSRSTRNHGWGELMGKRNVVVTKTDRIEDNDMIDSSYSKINITRG